MTTATLETVDGRKIDVVTGEVTAEDLRLFDLPTLDGHRADTLKLAFGGAVEIDKLINTDLEHFKGLRFGQEIELRVTGVIGKNAWVIKTDGEGYETVTNTIGIVVHSYTVDSE